MNPEPKVEIRRYPNRRLYDRTGRRYVTLKDIEDMVVAGQTVEVRDSRDGEDMTRQILTQILLERHPRKMEMFPVAMLHSVLRANDFAMELWRGYLQQSLASMEAWQKAAIPFPKPLDWVSAFFPGLIPGGAAPSAPPSSPTSTPPPDAAGDAVAERLAALLERVERLESGTATDGPAGASVDDLEARINGLEAKRPRAPRKAKPKSA